MRLLQAEQMFKVDTKVQDDDSISEFCLLVTLHLTNVCLLLSLILLPLPLLSTQNTSE